MNTNFPDRYPAASLAQDAVFSALREKLAHEVSSSAVLADLLERVNRMQEMQACPERFKEQFDEFVCRAEENIDVIRGFFPALVGFLPIHQAADEAGEVHRIEASSSSGVRAGLA